ncbi:hypothetical protein [Frisingicoccus sp.]|uniref:hypothetical protein n=1 Tax=Frisingicoccus sp. TaxID=1918627 RepID=UPI003AB893D1
MFGSPVALVESESIAPIAVSVTSVCSIRRDSRVIAIRNRTRIGMGTRAVTGCRLLLAGKDDPGKASEKGKDCFKVLHVN